MRRFSYAAGISDILFCEVKLIMDIKTKFNIGDNFVEIAVTTHIARIDCETCEGKGYIFLNQEVKADCLVCYGNGYSEVHGNEEWRPLVDEKNHDFYKRPIGAILIEVHGVDPKISIRYMRKNTGSYVDDRNCFADIEKAQAECDLRNREKERES